MSCAAVPKVDIGRSALPDNIACLGCRMHPDRNSLLLHLQFDVLSCQGEDPCIQSVVYQQRALQNLTFGDWESLSWTWCTRGNAKVWEKPPTAPAPVRLSRPLSRTLLVGRHLQMDCTLDENKEFKQKMGISGFPSFRVSTLGLGYPCDSQLELQQPCRRFVLSGALPYRSMLGGIRSDHNPKKLPVTRFCKCRASSAHSRTQWEGGRRLGCCFSHTSAYFDAECQSGASTAGQVCRMKLK